MIFNDLLFQLLDVSSLSIYTRVKSYLTITSLVLLTFHLFGQIRIVQIDGSPIPFAQVYTEDGRLFTQSTLEGMIESSFINNLQENETVIINHVSFEEKKLSSLELKNEKIILLERKVNELPSFEISSKEKKYRKLSGYFRSHQANDSINVYYFDGILDSYYKNSKFKYEHHLQQSRSFEIIDNPWSFEFGNQLVYKEIGLPYLDKDYLPQTYIREHNLLVDSTNRTNWSVLSADSVFIGSIVFNHHQITFSIDDIYSNQNRRLLNTEVNALATQLTFIFISSDHHQLPQDFDHLLYFRKQRHVKVKHKKQNDYTDVRTYHEFFVTEMTELGELPSLEFTRNWGMQKTSKCDYNYWEKCDNQLFKVTPETFLIGLEQL